MLSGPRAALWPMLLGAYWLIQASTLGVSDDEAYYWVLSRSPAFGYVYHPPLVAWLIRLFDVALGWTGLPRELLLRLPGILLSSATLLLSIDWIQRVRKERVLPPGPTVWVIVPGLAAMSWMMVPDHPLFFGWMLCFTACWRICADDHPRKRDLVLLALGAALGLLSKFSAILFCLSAAAAILLLTARARLRALLALGIGMTVAAAPILIWNASNDWTAILYQFQSRHAGGGWDSRRYATFWISQLLFAGPLLLASLPLAARNLREANVRPISRAEKFLLLWLLPAAVFLIQPAYSSFKPHWAIAFWLPVGMWCALAGDGGRVHAALSRLQGSFILFLVILTFATTQWPIASLTTQWWTGRPANPLWDPSNDLAGWSELPAHLARKDIPPETPVIGSRYQTAAQAGFALWPERLATLAPASLIEKKEWPQLESFLTSDPEGHWPRLKKPVVYVQDDRYGQGPGFPDADCQSSGSIDSPRLGMAPKRIHTWFCRPR